MKKRIKMHARMKMNAIIGNCMHAYMHMHMFDAGDALLHYIGEVRLDSSLLLLLVHLRIG
jgi:hypothetical protein